MKFYSKAFDKHYETQRIIGEYHGNTEGPVLVFFGGVHGNESAGVLALQNVMEEIHQTQPNIKGSIYAIAGNLNALEKNIRFEEEDLNRVWTKERINKLENDEFDPSSSNADVLEQKELFELGKAIFKKHNKQIYCIDLHTTSGPTVPFITLNDTVINRQFATQFPVPVVVGIEEFLVGPIMNWIMELGYPALAFEAGEHHNKDSVKYHEAFAWLSMVYGGLISKEALPQFNAHLNLLTESNADLRKVFEVWFRKEVKPADGFKMLPGYSNLQEVQKGEQLAESNQGGITALESSRIFMPLYQEKGNDGFFLARELSPSWLRLSEALRKFNIGSVLPILPGISRDKNDTNTLILSTASAKMLGVNFLNILGYRIKVKGENTLSVTKRTFDVKSVSELK
ncbi:MAG: succinylglutamate desuccinylase/aspartoacylase family protein [Flavobacteriales bacterium]